MAYLVVIAKQPKTVFELSENNYSVKDTPFVKSRPIDLTQDPDYERITQTVSLFAPPSNILGCDETYNVINVCNE